jgi:hypothetical protein
MRNLVAVDDLIDRLAEQGFYEGPAACHDFTAAVEDAVIYFQQTHLGSDGFPLVVDGIVGKETWWALKHPSGKSQRSYLQPKIPKGIVGERAKVLQVAIAEHAKNVRERPNGSNRSKEIDKYFPQWLQNKLMLGEKGPPWCCFSANWVFHEATGRWPCGRRTGSCATMARWAKEQDIWFPLDLILEGHQIIRPGDFFVILHPRKPNKPATGHIGIVGSTNKQQSKFGTYEGNCGNRYKAGLRSIGEIAGIINPYDEFYQPTDFARVLPKVDSVAASSTR